jgi:methyltransferase (TIGR00027 family)
MSMTPVGTTSRWIAAARALETEGAEPLFRDEHARALAGEAGFAMMAAVREGFVDALSRTPDPYLTIRTRFLDDAIVTAVCERSIRQVVVLAAGMDARAFRLDWPGGVVLFELDRREIFDVKEPILESTAAVARCQRRVIACDLAQEWSGTLIAAGFDPSRPAAILAEGLIMYLEESAVLGLMAAVSSLAAAGSWLGLDIPNREMLTSHWTQPMMNRLRELGCPWVYGCEDIEAMFESFGWHPTLVGPAEAGTGYGRWPYPIVPASTPGVPKVVFVDATRMEVNA